MRIFETPHLSIGSTGSTSNASTFAPERDRLGAPRCGANENDRSQPDRPDLRRRRRDADERRRKPAFRSGGERRGDGSGRRRRRFIDNRKTGVIALGDDAGQGGVGDDENDDGGLGLAPGDLAPLSAVEENEAPGDGVEPAPPLPEVSAIAAEGDDFDLENEGLIAATQLVVARMNGVSVGGDDAEIENDGQIIVNAIQSDELNGIVVEGDEAEIENEGTILSTDGAGVALANEDIEFVNEETVAGVAGVAVQAGRSEIVNAGEIVGSFNGVNFVNGGEADGRFENLGAITCDSRGVNIGGDDIDVISRGEILGTGDQRNGVVYADASADDFAVINEETGLIDAGMGNVGAGVSLQIGDEEGETVDGDLFNDGVIRGRGPCGDLTASPEDGDGVVVFAGTTEDALVRGSIVNVGTIEADDDGVTIAQDVRFEGDIVNEGLISGMDDGVTLDDVAIFDGDVFNDGEISAGDTAIDIQTIGRFEGDVFNDGRIETLGDAITIQELDALIGDFLNRDEISAGSAGFEVIDSALFEGEVINEGSIEAGADAVNLDGASSVIGDISNLGFISAERIGVSVSDNDSFVGDILNTGSNEAETDGIEASRLQVFAGDIVNDGVLVNGPDVEIVNEGEIVGDADGDGVGRGVEVRGGDFDLLNEGSVDGGVTADEADGRIRNGGVIIDDQTGVEIRAAEVRVVNESVISGDLNGVSFVNGGESGGALLNRSLITSDSRAVNTGGFGVELVNIGAIMGTDVRRDGTVYVDGTADDFSILNADSAIIDAGGDVFGAGVSFQIGTEDDQTVRGELSNRGEIVGRGFNE